MWSIETAHAVGDRHKNDKKGRGEILELLSAREIDKKGGRIKAQTWERKAFRKECGRKGVVRGRASGTNKSKKKDNRLIFRG